MNDYVGVVEGEDAVSLVTMCQKAENHDIIEVAGELRRETDKAYLLFDGARRCGSQSRSVSGMKTRKPCKCRNGWPWKKD
jgi:hypothetical protein